MAQELEQDRHRTDLGEDLEVGHEPFGDADPGSCGADASECEVEPHVFDGPPERCEVPIVEEAMEPFVPAKTVFGIDPQDGLPVPINEGPDLHEAPELRYDNFVCVEDARQYVEMFASEFVHWGAREQAVRAMLAARDVTFTMRTFYNDDGFARARRTCAPGKVDVAFGVSYTMVSDKEAMLVRPIRPRCEHYRRQILSQDGVPEGELGHFLVFRNCAVRRSVGGALMSLRDQAVYACDYRSPPDPESAKKHLDEPEKKKLEREPVRLPMFTKPAVPLPDFDA